jgi:histidinol-phosphatase (PHP family)
MTTLIDYHVHTNNSIDCKVSMAQMCAQAVQLGLTEIAFTDHFNNHPLDLDLGYYDPERYFADLEHCRAEFPTLIIRAGVELGEPHRWGSKIIPVLERYPYDLVLGSLHWVGKNSMFDANYFRNRSPQFAFREYFTELIQMINHGGFDILSHVDVPKRTGFSVYREFNISVYEDIMRKVWQACIDTGITPEINTKGLRSSAAQMHPTTDALSWYAEMGGERLTLGSDAHQAGSLADYFGDARQSALTAGIKRICRFERRSICGWVDL